MPGAPRFFCPAPLESGLRLELPATAARHVQVLRLQPGAAITLFGHLHSSTPGGEFSATISAMGRQHVEAVVGAHDPVEREAARQLHLAIGIPANERMDWLVEKATELGAASIQPLMTERSVVRLDAQRSVKKLAHWQSIAIAASEQCGRNHVATVHAPVTLSQWLRQTPPPHTTTDAALILSLRPDACPLPQWRGGPG
ncbi:MAG: 16S rRNA (uracil(1498)-N(3))-methyltransferase, partial [Burkholderiaceae bacterium]